MTDVTTKTAYGQPYGSAYGYPYGKFSGIGMRSIAALVVAIMVWIGFAKVADANPTVPELMDTCDATVRAGEETELLKNALTPDSNNAATRNGVFEVSGGRVFVSTITSADTGRIVICMIDGARRVDDTWETGVLWDAHGPALETHLEGLVPSGAVELTKTPDPLEMHLYQRQFLDCEADMQWGLGPHYQSDGGFLFPVSIDWRLEGAVMNYLVMSPLFPATRNKMCAG